MNFAKNLAGLPKGCQVGTVRSDFDFPLQLDANLLIELVELGDTFNKCVLLSANVFSVSAALLDAGEHLFEELEGRNRAVELGEVVCELVKVLEKDCDNLLESCLDTVVKLLVLGRPVVPQTFLVLQLLRLRKEVV